MSSEMTSKEPSSNISDMFDKENSEATTRDEMNEEKKVEGTTAKRPAKDDGSSQPEDMKRCRRVEYEDDEEVVDMAVKIGLKPGDRIQVQWDLTDDVAGATETRWWGASLTEYDGRLIDKAAIRVLDYDPYVAGGFPERSREDVCFVDEDYLVSNFGTDGDEGQVMRWRREGEEATFVLDEEGLREEINGMLLNLTSKHSSLFQRLDAAKQAVVAEKIAKGKEDLLSAIRKRWQESDRIISSADMHSILAETFGKQPNTGS